MYKIAVVGDMDSIYGFKSVGLDVYPVEDAPAAVGLLKELTENGYAIIYMVESLCRQIEKELDSYGEGMLPAIIPIPGATGKTGYGVGRVRKFVEQAVGSDILFGD